MDTGLLIGLLNPTIALVLGAVLLVLWFYQRHRPYLAVLAASYWLSAIGFLLQHFTLPIGMAPTKLISNLWSRRRDHGPAPFLTGEALCAALVTLAC